jgi:hypothetical protein
MEKNGVIIKDLKNKDKVTGMKNSKDSCIEFFQNEEIRNNIREIIKPIANIMYNELYLYIWLLCIYSVFLLVIGLANIILLITHLSRSAKLQQL